MTPAAVTPLNHVSIDPSLSSSMESDSLMYFGRIKMSTTFHFRPPGPISEKLGAALAISDKDGSSSLLEIIMKGSPSQIALFLDDKLYEISGEVIGNNDMKMINLSAKNITNDASDWNPDLNPSYAQIFVSGSGHIVQKGCSQPENPGGPVDWVVAVCHHYKGTMLIVDCELSRNHCCVPPNASLTLGMRIKYNGVIVGNHESTGRICVRIDSAKIGAIL